MSIFIEIPVSKISIAQRKSICGKGINDSDYHVRCPYYVIWSSMISRCYSGRDINYIDCTVCDEWLLFSNFRQWMETQEWEGKELDKDIIVPGNKIYSPETCVFVFSGLNNLLCDRKLDRGKYPIGVVHHKKSGKFQSRCKVNGIDKHIGLYTTVNEATIAYRNFKSSLVLEIANKQTDNRVKQGLILHAKLIKRPPQY